MFDKLSFIEDRFRELEDKISDPEIIADQEQWRKFCKEHSDISPIVAKYREYKNLKENIEDVYSEGYVPRRVGKFVFSHLERVIRPEEDDRRDPYR